MELTPTTGFITPPEPADIPIDVPPRPDDGGHYCRVCNVELVKTSVKGPWPTLCPDHKTSSTPTTGGRGRATNVDKLVEQIAGFYRNVGVGVTFVIPNAETDGMIICDAADDLAKSWKSTLERDKKMRDWWEKFFESAGMGAIIMAHFGVGMRIAQAHGFSLAKYLPGAPKTEVIE